MFLPLFGYCIILKFFEGTYPRALHFALFLFFYLFEFIVFLANLNPNYKRSEITVASEAYRFVDYFIFF